MKTYKIILFSLILLITSFSLKSQNQKFYLRAIDQNFNPQFYLKSNSLTYSGKDRALKKLFNENTITVFEKAFTHSKRPSLQRVWYVEGNGPSLMDNFLRTAPTIFEYGSIADDAALADTYPDDYGTTIPASSGVVNLGADADQGYFDFIGLPQAWDYATGAGVIVGLSDGGVPINDSDFVNKTTVFSPGCTSGCGYHGYSVGAILTAQGDNSYGTTGVAYNSELYATAHGNYNRLLELAVNGARVINCSWGSPNSNYPNGDPMLQEVIDEITEDHHAIVVAASHNLASYRPQGTIVYPAGFDNVISVGTVGYKNDFNYQNIGTVTTSGGNTQYNIRSVKYALSGSVGFRNNNPSPQNYVDQSFIFQGNTAQLNERVDILGPGGPIFRYKNFVNNNGEISYLSEGHFTTSSVTPIISGTIALLFELNPCLSFTEVESILKIGSYNIDSLPFNRNFAQEHNFHNKYGSGALHAGTSVKLVHDLLDETETAYLENQKFSRWNFEFNGVSEKIVIRNQEFTKDSKLNVIAKNRILIEENTLISPNQTGGAGLRIDPNLLLSDCGLAGRKPSWTNNNDLINEDKSDEPINLYNLYPTRVSSVVTIDKKQPDSDNLIQVEVYDLISRKVFSQSNLQGESLSFDLSNLKVGLYLVRGYNANNEIVLTEKIIKL